MPILNPDGSIGFSSAKELAEYQKLMAPAPVKPVLPSSTSASPIVGHVPAQTPSNSVAGQLSLPSTISTSPRPEANPRPEIDLPVDRRTRISDLRRVELQNYGYRNATMTMACARFVLSILRDYAPQVPNPKGYSFHNSEGRARWLMEQDSAFVSRMNDWTGVSMALRDRERLMWSLGVSSALFAISICYGHENAERARQSISRPNIIQQLIDGCVELVTLSSEGEGGRRIHISPEDSVVLFERMFLVLSEAVK